MLRWRFLIPFCILPWRYLAKKLPETFFPLLKGEYWHSGGPGKEVLEAEDQVLAVLTGDSHEWEDIEELRYSDITIAKDDIEEKTREGANVKSYKIAIKAEYLEKALKPETWPLRVKVREWVYFPRKREHQPEGGRMGQREARAQGRGDGAGASLYKYTTVDGTAATAPKEN